MELNEIKKPKEYLNAYQVAEFMKVNYRTVIRMAKDRRLEYVNLRPGRDRIVYGFLPEFIQNYYDSIQNSPSRVEAVNQ